MKAYLWMLFVTCVAFNATLAHLNENELGKALLDVRHEIGSGEMEVLRVLMEAFMICEKRGRGLEFALADYLGHNTHAYGKKRKDFDKYFKKTIGEACSSLIKAVSKYESDYEHLREEDPDYFPHYHVMLYFKGLNYCRTITQNLEDYAEKTYNVN